MPVSWLGGNPFAIDNDSCRQWMLIVNQANDQEKLANDEKKRWESYLEELDQSRVLTGKDLEKLRELTQGLDKVRKTKETASPPPP